MKKNKNNQLPPNLLGFWSKGCIKDGAIIKKRNTKPIIINIYTEKNNEDNDDDIITIYKKKRYYIRYANLIKIFNIINKN